MSPTYSTAQHTHLLCSLAILFTTGCTNLSESRFLVPKDEEPDMKSAVIMEEPDSRPDMPEEEDMRPELDMRDDGKCTRVSDCKTDLPNVVASCDSNGRCNYQCSTDEEQTWAVIQNQVIDVNGCNCEVLPEICNGEDEDCDGVPDNDLTLECEVQDGVCAGALNYCNGDSDSFNSSCSNETYREHATNNGFFFSDNVYESHRCDGLDNNCDGRVDEACCVNSSDDLIHIKDIGIAITPFKLFKHHSLPNSFFVLGASGGDVVQAVAIDQGAQEDQQPNYEASYRISATNRPQTLAQDGVQLHESQALKQLRVGSTQQGDGIIHQILLTNPSEFYNIVSHDPNVLNPKPPEDPEPPPELMWLPRVSLEDQTHPPQITSSLNDTFIGGWVNVNNPNNATTVEFRACIGRVLSQDCATHQFTYQDEFEEPQPIAIAGLKQGGRFFLFHSKNDNTYRYLVYNSISRQVAKDQLIQLSTQVTGDRHVGKSKALWVSPNQVLVSQYVWYPEHNLNQLEFALIDVDAPIERALLAQKSLVIDATRPNAVGELIVVETLENNLVVLWSENARNIKSSTLEVSSSNQLSISLPQDLAPPSLSDHSLSLNDAVFNGRHLGVLITGTRESGATLRTDFFLIASPEGSPLCPLLDEPTD